MWKGREVLIITSVDQVHRLVQISCGFDKPSRTLANEVHRENLAFIFENVDEPFQTDRKGFERSQDVIVRGVAGWLRFDDESDQVL